MLALRLDCISVTIQMVCPSLWQAVLLSLTTQMLVVIGDDPYQPHSYNNPVIPHYIWPTNCRRDEETKADSSVLTHATVSGPLFNLVAIVPVIEPHIFVIQGVRWAPEPGR
jgi:hypothetical protein